MEKEKKYQLKGVSLGKLNLFSSNSKKELNLKKTIYNTNLDPFKRRVLLNKSMKKIETNFSATKLSLKKIDILPSNRTLESNLSNSNCKTMDTTKRKKNKKYNLKPIVIPFNKENFFKYFKLQKVRKKYHLILDNHPKHTIEYKGLPGIITNCNNDFKKLLNKQNQSIFNSPFSLIQKERFYKKYQNILERFSFNKENIKSKSPETIHFKTLSLFELHNKKIKFENEKRLKEEEEKINIKNTFDYHKQLINKFKIKMLKMYYHLKRCKISIQDILEGPYLRKTSNEKRQIFNKLIRSIKIKNIKLSLLILEEYKHIVYSCDLYNQTPLHWVSKRNFYQIIPKILSYGANINSIDFAGYTPLHLSIINNHFDTFVILILYGASPFIYDNFHMRPIDYCKDFKYQNLLKKCSILHIGNSFGKYKHFFEDLQFELSRFIEIEFRFDLEKTAFNIVKSIRLGEEIIYNEKFI